MSKIGSPPKASQFSPGGIWLVMECPDENLAPQAWQAHVYAYSPPRVDWGDMTDYEAMDEPEYAPSGAAPGLWTENHLYGSIGPFEVNVMTDQVNTRARIFVGDIPVFDPDEFRLTMGERWAKELERYRAIKQATPWLGAPDNSVGGYTVKDPVGKQSDA